MPLASSSAFHDQPAVHPHEPGIHLTVSMQASAFRPGWVPRGGSCASAGHTLEQSGPKRCANTGSDPNHSNRANGHRG